MMAFNGSIYLERAFDTDALRLRIYRYDLNRTTSALLEDGTWAIEAPEGTMYPKNPGVLVHRGHGNQDFVKALRAACDEYLHEPEPNAVLIQELRHTLAVEQRRVDETLKALLGRGPS